MSLDYEATIIGAALDDQGQAEAESFLYDLMLGIENDHLFDNGLELGFRLGGRVQQDHAQRPGFAGNFQSSDTDQAVVGVRSPTTGIAYADAPLDEGVRARLEQAYIYLDGGWGEVSVGRDVGVASRLDARPPTLLESYHGGTSRLDPSGIAFVRARNDPTGPSAKISYLSPRWLGVRLGASFTPQADADSVDFDPDTSVSGVNTADLENVLEFAASFSRKFGQADLDLRIGLNGATGQSGSNFATFRDYEAFGAGIEIEKGAWQYGVRYLSSNNAVESGDYTATEMSVVRQFGDWRIGAEYGVAEDEFLNMEGSSWLVGIHKNITDQFAIGLAYTDSDLDINNSNMPEGSAAKGVILELTVRNK